ncbi:hypothetical protein LCGC14_0387380 [marine sediment metagenome]|uniref:Uncharacterized protein n=1 Tax=marine sediment metagenome TaxID=412755 RepID=A0A0F9VMH8_9ZZZZ
MKNIKKSLSKISEKNPQWKGDSVGLSALHEWLTLRIPKPNKCQRCNKAKPHDLANRRGNYNRDLNEWWWLCRRCHMEEDGRLDNLRERNRADGASKEVQCIICGKFHLVCPSKLKLGLGRYCSLSCTAKGTHLKRGHILRQTNKAGE